MAHGFEESSRACATRPPTESVEEVVLCCLPAIHRWARRKLPAGVGAHLDASDLVQEAALRLISHRDDFQPGHREGIQAYMRQIVINLIRDEARRKARRPASVGLSDDYPCPNASPLRCTIDRETWARYRSALRRLKPRDRAILVARLEFHRSARDIARAFGLPTPASAGVAVRRALRRLRQEIAERQERIAADRIRGIEPRPQR
jgi:RNA polymerase sigma factor (sigma-70 family)